ncbi:MAG TPA: FAD-dependent oxidoreductase, partial [Rubrobacteraceae bacterium]|nr:FAD-dependent oxidoreductase [Rubrobacteraceae bacterium]
MYDFAVIGGGIVGLSTAWTLLRRYPGAGVVVLEKEETLARHQTGHNSGVIHSGVYYKPGSMKARFAREG